VIRNLEDYGVTSPHDLPVAPKPYQPNRLRSQTEPFLRGPIPLTWLSLAADLRKPALSAGIALWFIRGVSKKTGAIRVTAAVRKKMGLSGNQMLRGLRALELAGLVRFVKEGRGRCPVVEIIDRPRQEAGPE
jgi:hypothetical protein